MQCNLVNEHAVSYTGIWMAVHVCWEMCTKTAAALTAHFGSGSCCVLPWALVFISLLVEMIQAKTLRNELCVILCCSNRTFCSLHFVNFTSNILGFIFCLIESVFDSLKDNYHSKIP